MVNLHPLLLPTIEAAKKAPRDFRFVFDLDSTLYCVSPRSQKILRDLAAQPEFMAKYPEECRRLAVIEALPNDWGIRMMLERSQIRSTIRFFEDVRSFWLEHFFSSRYLQYDQPYEGAVEFVNFVESLGLDVWYLTGRDEIRMREGSLRSFTQWGLPLANEKQLVMKPKAGMVDEDFKVDQLRQWSGNGKTIVFFENEPVIIEKVRHLLPEVQIIFMESVHSGRRPSPTDLVSLPMSFSKTPSV